MGLLLRYGAQATDLATCGLVLRMTCHCGFTLLHVENCSILEHVHSPCRWLYLASAAGEVMAGSGFGSERYRVVHGRPGELRLGQHVPVCCNVLVGVG